MGFGLEEFGLRWRRAPLVLAHVRPSDGTAAVLSQDLEETCERLDDPTDARAWRVLMERWDRIESAFVHTFFTPFPPVVGTARLAGRIDPRDLLRFARFAALDVRRMGHEHFRGRDGADLLAGTALHGDLAPEAVGSGAFGWIMCGLGQRHGFPVPEGGSGQLTAALVTRLEQRGGRVRCSQPVERIVLRNGRAVGVQTAHGERVEAGHAVLADVAAPQLYLRLVGREHLTSRLVSDLERFQLDSSTVKVDCRSTARSPGAIRRRGGPGPST